jgi:hypothetical protein
MWCLLCERRDHIQVFFTNKTLIGTLQLREATKNLVGDPSLRKGRALLLA